MALTKEECKEALEKVKEFGCLCCTCCDETFEERQINKENFKECSNKIEQLINEHFDNPPLKFEEIVQMIGKPVYFKNEWFLIWRTDYYKSTRKSISLINRTGNVVEVAFEDNRFYRREVHDE